MPSRHESAPLEAPAHEPPGEFHRRLGLFDATMLVVGTMIGSGVFIVAADIARTVASAGWMMVVWVLGGVVTVIGALAYAELAAMMPRAGGQYVYLREQYGPLCGFLYGWATFLVIQTGTIAAVAVSFAKFLGVLLPKLGNGNILYRIDGLDWRIAVPLPWLADPLVVFQRDAFTISAGQLVAACVVIGLTLWNMRGIEQGKWVQNVFTIAKTLALVVLVVLAFSIAANSTAIEANWTDLWSGIHATPAFAETEGRFRVGQSIAVLMLLGGAMVGSLFAFDSWHNVAFTAGEIRNVRRNLPLSMVLGTITVMVLYLVVNVAYLCVLPVNGSPDGVTPIERGIAHAKEDRVATAVVELAEPDWGVTFMAVAVMVSTFGCVNGMTLMGARLYYAMARDGLFPAAIGRLNRRGVPAAGLLLQGAWTTVLVFSGTYTELLDYVIFAALLFYVLTVLGLFVLRIRQPQAERPYRALGYPVLPAFYVVFCGAVMIDLLLVKPVFTWPGLVIVLSGVPVYYAWRWLRR